MGIHADMQKEMVAALKARDSVRRGALSFLASELKKVAVDKRIPELPDADAIPILQKQLKLRQDALAQAQAAQRADLVESSEYEIRLIGEFLPKGLSAEETRALATAVVAELGASSMKDMGKVMAELGKRAAAIDKAVASGIVKGLLAGK